MNGFGAVLRQHWVALRAMAVLTVVLGIAYPLAITGVGQLVAHSQANGSMITSGGRTVGSSLIGQSFSDAKGNPLRQYFQPRPSAAGDAGYDGASSTGSNLGPESKDLVAQIAKRKTSVARFDGVPESQVPADAVTASSSGLDPHISTAYADIQIARVAAARGIAADRVRSLVARYTNGRDLGYLGEPTVNVVQLNAALDAAHPVNG
ncbi:MAG: potassium-transporting ATPase subunit KdpC [Pseudoclavibacter sp.]